MSLTGPHLVPVGRKYILSNSFKTTLRFKKSTYSYSAGTRCGSHQRGNGGIICMMYTVNMKSWFLAIPHAWLHTIMEIYDLRFNLCRDYYNSICLQLKRYQRTWARRSRGTTGWTWSSGTTTTTNSRGTSVRSPPSTPRLPPFTPLGNLYKVIWSPIDLASCQHIVSWNGCICYLTSGNGILY